LGAVLKVEILVAPNLPLLWCQLAVVSGDLIFRTAVICMQKK
jgi:hypothetical protein